MDLPQFNLLGKDSPHAKAFWTGVGAIGGFLLMGPIGAIAGGVLGNMMGANTPPLPNPSIPPAGVQSATPSTGYGSKEGSTDLSSEVYRTVAIRYFHNADGVRVDWKADAGIPGTSLTLLGGTGLNDVPTAQADAHHTIDGHLSELASVGVTPAGTTTVPVNWAPGDPIPGAPPNSPKPTVVTGVNTQQLAPSLQRYIATAEPQQGPAPVVLATVDGPPQQWDLMARIAAFQIAGTPLVDRLTGTTAGLFSVNGTQFYFE